MNTQRLLPLLGLATGGLLALAPIFSFVGTLYSIYHVYRVMNTAGVGAAQDQAGEVGWMFLVTVGSLFLCLLGVALAVASWSSYTKAMPRPITVPPPPDGPLD